MEGRAGQGGGRGPCLPSLHCTHTHTLAWPCGLPAMPLCLPCIAILHCTFAPLRLCAITTYLLTAALFFRSFNSAIILLCIPRHPFAILWRYILCAVRARAFCMFLEEIFIYRLCIFIRHFARFLMPHAFVEYVYAASRQQTFAAFFLPACTIALPAFAFYKL